MGQNDRMPTIAEPSYGQEIDSDILLDVLENPTRELGSNKDVIEFKKLAELLKPLGFQSRRMVPIKGGGRIIFFDDQHQTYGLTAHDLTFFACPNFTPNPGEKWVLSPPSRGRSSPLNSRLPGIYPSVLGNGRLLATGKNDHALPYHTEVHRFDYDHGYPDDYEVHGVVDPLDVGKRLWLNRYLSDNAKSTLAHLPIATVKPTHLMATNLYDASDEEKRSFYWLENTRLNAQKYGLTDAFGYPTILFMARISDSPLTIYDVAYPLLQAINNYILDIDPELANLISTGQYWLGKLFSAGNILTTDQVAIIESILSNICELYLPALCNIHGIDKSDLFELVINNLLSGYVQLIKEGYLYLNPHSQNISTSGKFTEPDVNLISKYHGSRHFLRDDIDIIHEILTNGFFEIYNNMLLVGLIFGLPILSIDQLYANWKDSFSTAFRPPIGSGYDDGALSVLPNSVDEIEGSTGAFCFAPNLGYKDAISFAKRLGLKKN